MYMLLLLNSKSCFLLPCILHTNSNIIILLGMDTFFTM